MIQQKWYLKKNPKDCVQGGRAVGGDNDDKQV